MSTSETNALLIDGGNSSLKWAFYRSGKLEPGDPVVYQPSTGNATPASLLANQLKVSWKKITDAENCPGRIIVSNVAGTWFLEGLNQWVNEDLKKGFPVKDANELTIDSVIARENSFDVTNAYAQPEQLGADRWAGLIAARHLVEGDSAVIDCGSALTIDILDGSGVHQGGTISPGWQMMKQSLVKETNAITERVLNREFTVPALLGKDTGEAVEAGVAAACAGAVKHVIERYQDTAGVTLQCIITGGGARQLLKQLLQIYPEGNFQYEPDWVLKGLAIISDNIVKNDSIKGRGNNT